MAEFIIGTSGWTYADWAGKFYPQKLPRREWLNYYCATFPIVEVNATFYRAIADSTYLNWYKIAPASFHFNLKASMGITHRKSFESLEGKIQKFWTAAQLLQEKLGLILLQFPPQLKSDFAYIKAILTYFPQPERLVFEFRNPTWQVPAMQNLLKAYGAIYCIPDSPEQELNAILTADTTYLRLHGRRKWFDDNYTAAELTEIKDFAKGLAQQGARKIYILFNNTYSGYGANNALTLMKLLKISNNSRAN